ncbi:MAG: flavodoxin [Lachnospiraceae bacterium]|jgi:flavodoxin
MKTLIAYFSYSGNTKKIAEQLQEKTNGELFRIETVKPYSSDYQTCAYKEAKQEYEQDIHPAIKKPLPDIAAYDKIIVAFPIWWYTCPKVILSFFEAYPDWQKKTVYLFANSYTDDPKYMETSLKDVKACANNADIRRGLFNGEIKKLDNWLAKEF